MGEAEDTLWGAGHCYPGGRGQYIMGGCEPQQRTLFWGGTGHYGGGAEDTTVTHGVLHAIFLLGT